ncbi:MAG: rhomboid family intramembrane serine protease, partial [Deltaproteobacteria bacterium]
DYARYGVSFRLGPAVKWLLVANGVAYLLELIVGRLPGGLEFIYSELAISLPQVLKGRIWQLVTYMFLHDPTGLSHILWNMLLLWMFGTPLEMFWGMKGFLKFYFITGVGAAVVVLLSGLMFPGQAAIPTLGASGALYALLVAYGFNYPNSVVYLFGLFPIKGKHLVMLFVGLGLLQCFTLSASNVSVAAHLGGMLMGFLLVTGTWRPSKALYQFRMLMARMRYRRLKRKMRVVEKDSDRWLH